MLLQNGHDDAREIWLSLALAQHHVRAQRAAVGKNGTSLMILGNKGFVVDSEVVVGKKVGPASQVAKVFLAKFVPGVIKKPGLLTPFPYTWPGALLHQSHELLWLASSRPSAPRPFPSSCFATL